MVSITWSNKKKDSTHGNWPDILMIKDNHRRNHPQVISSLVKSC